MHQAFPGIYLIYKSLVQLSVYYLTNFKTYTENH